MKKTHKIYIARAISGSKLGQEQRNTIMTHSKKYGTVVNESFFVQAPTLTSDEVYDHMLQYIAQANVFIAEISGPSHGVGREICYAQNTLQIPVLCLYDTKYGLPSPVLEGNKDIHVFPYETDDDIKQIINNFFTHRIQ